MDVTCQVNSTSTLQTVLGISTTNLQQTSTCSNPIYYYLGYGIDIIIVISVAWFIKWLIT